MEEILIVPTFQRSTLDLVKMGEAIEAEKDRLLMLFMKFAQQVCDHLQEQGYWADYIDPCSGLPMIHQAGSTVYSEVDAASTLLGFSTQNAGCCKVLLHPKWKTYVYPATLMAKSPKATLQEALHKAEGIVH